MPPPPPVSLICIKSLMAFWSPGREKRTQCCVVFWSCTFLSRELVCFFQCWNCSWLTVHMCGELTDIVSAVANVGRYLVHTLAIKSSHLLSKCTSQFLVNGSVDIQTHICMSCDTRGSIKLLESRQYFSFDLASLKDYQIGFKTTVYFPYNSSGSHTVKMKYSTGINCWLCISSHSELTCTYWRPPWLVSTPAAQTPPYQSDRQCRPEMNITRSVI